MRKRGWEFPTPDKGPAGDSRREVSQAQQLPRHTLVQTCWGRQLFRLLMCVYCSSVTACWGCRNLNLCGQRKMQRFPPGTETWLAVSYSSNKCTKTSWTLTSLSGFMHLLMTLPVSWIQQVYYSFVLKPPFSKENVREFCFKSFTKWGLWLWQLPVFKCKLMYSSM